MYVDGIHIIPLLFYPSCILYTYETFCTYIIYYYIKYFSEVVMFVLHSCVRLTPTQSHQFTGFVIYFIIFNLFISSGGHIVVFGPSNKHYSK